MPLFKITLTDGDGEILFEKDEESGRGWSSAVLWCDELENAMDELDGRGSSGVTKLIITAERVQTDVAPPDPIRQDPATPETDAIDDDEEEDDDPALRYARMAVEPDNPATTGFNEATGDYKTPTEAA